jgi:hypothetical protein
MKMAMTIRNEFRVNKQIIAMNIQNHLEIQLICPNQIGISPSVNDISFGI